MMIAALFARKSTDQADDQEHPVFRPYTTAETVSNEHRRAHSLLPRNLPPTLENTDNTAGCADRLERVPPLGTKVFPPVNRSLRFSIARKAP